MCLVHGSLHWMGITCAPPTFAPNAAHSKSGGLAGRPPASWRTPGCSICSSPTPPSRPSWHSPFLLPAHAGRLGLPGSVLPASPLHRPPPHWPRLLMACHHCPSLHWGGCLPAPERHTRSTFPGVIPLQLLFINAHQSDGWLFDKLLRQTQESKMQVMVVTGLVVMAGAGILLSWQKLAIMALPLPFIFAFVLWRLPPSPAWLLERGREGEARKVLAWLRDLQPEDVEVPSNPMAAPQETRLAALRQLAGVFRHR